MPIRWRCSTQSNAPLAHETKVTLWIAFKIADLSLLSGLLNTVQIDSIKGNSKSNILGNRAVCQINACGTWQ